MEQHKTSGSNASSSQKTLLKIRLTLLFFIVALALSGLTAFPLRWELELLTTWFGEGTTLGTLIPGLGRWVERVHEGLEFNAKHYPFMSYGTDWLAFAHIVIAIAFWGPFRDPVRNIWVIEFGMICCILVFPLAFICGSVRQIPLGWQLIDCSFGFLGIIPLILIHRWTRNLEREKQKEFPPDLEQT
ncbi:MAG: hypothetical protein Q4D38_11715 [Planctomycetia bacterium]|nr:hypothetical protein [Planctomycetia bacterium]